MTIPTAIRRPALPAALIGVVAATYVLALASSYDLRVLTLAGIYILMVLGYQFIFGHAGALSLAQGAFFGLGAYVTGILSSQLGWSFPVTFPLSIAAPALLAALIAVPVLRLESHYFALATLAVAQGILLIAINWLSITGGANGLPGVPGIVLFGETVGRGLPLMLFVWGIVALAALLAARILRGLYGQAFIVARETPLAVGTLGIDAAMLRFTAFVLSAAYGGAAGALFVHTMRVVSPEVLGFTVMVTCLTMTVIGGKTRIAGAFIGGLLLTFLPEWFRGLEEYYLIAVGIVLLATMLFMPNGIAALLPQRGSPGAEPYGGDPTRVPVSLPHPHRQAALAVQDVSKSYGGVRALNGISLSVAPGEIVGLIGTNGSGKTTLANLISGLDHPDAGRIAIGDEDISGSRAFHIARSGIARTFQTPQLPAEMSARDAVAAGLAGHWPGQASRGLTAARQEADTMLAALDLTPVAGLRCADLPHGVRRRVELARCLIRKPALLVLDEPAAGLGSEESSLLAAALRTYARNGGAILIIDHDMSFLLPLAQRLICLDAGNVIAEGPPQSVTADPAVLSAYFGRVLA